MTRTVLFDATRLLSRTERDAPTGVDRVCLAYAEWLLALPHVTVQPVRSRRGELLAVDAPWFSRQIAEMRTRWTGGSQAPSPGETALEAALAAGAPAGPVVRSPPPSPASTGPRRRLRLWNQMVRSRQPAPSANATLYVNVGHTGLDDDGILRSLSADGVECLVFLHDLIPVTHPEYCRVGDGDRHRARVMTTLRHASRIIVNSAYTAEVLTDFAATAGVAAPPVHVAHLGLEPLFFQPPKAWPARPYFVHVGTIEARKNLAFLLTVWRRLSERLGAGTPQLVLIGRYGWENEATLDLLERSPNLQTLVHHVADLSDAAVARLMSQARAVLAPSSVEGFDLPAVEACALGVPLIASDIPVHRELAPDARLVDPLDGPGWLAAIEAALAGGDAPLGCSHYTWENHFEGVGRVTGLVASPVKIRSTRTANAH